MRFTLCKESENNMILVSDTQSYTDLKRFFTKILVFSREEGGAYFRVYHSDKEKQFILTRNEKSSENWKEDVIKLLEDNHIMIDKRIIESIAPSEKQSLLIKKND